MNMGSFLPDTVELDKTKLWRKIKGSEIKQNKNVLDKGGYKSVWFYIIGLLLIMLPHTKGSVSSLLATRQDRPDPTAPSPYPRTLPSPPIENAW